MFITQIKKGRTESLLTKSLNTFCLYYFQILESHVNQHIYGRILRVMLY